MSLSYMKQGRRKFGNGFCNGCNGCQSDESRKKEEGRKSLILVYIS
ncbi:hypothetical protein QUA20_04465 [Microcoleus sp. Pol7_A1]